MADPMVLAKIREKYPHLAWIADIQDPDIQAAIAGMETMTSAEFQAKIYASAWYKSHAASVREWEALLNTDPETAHQRHVAQYAKVQDLSRRMGLEMTHEQLHYFSLDTLRFGWDDDQINDKLVALIGPYPGGEARAAPGTFAQTTAAVRQLYDAYMIPDDGGQEGGIFNWSKQILAGETTLEGLAELMRDSAIRLHPHLKDLLDKGNTMTQIFTPYASEIARLLEITPDQIDWQKDIRFKEIIDYRGEDGQVRLPSLAELDQKIKTDSRYGWDYTKTARTEAAQMTSAFLSRLGLQ